MNGPVLMLSGVPGTGKSSLARAWLQSFEHGLHLPVDDLRELVVSGTAHPSLVADIEVARQFTLARKVAFGAAALYARDGFAVAMDDVLWPHDPDVLQATVLSGLRVTRVFLSASLETILQRNLARTSKPFAPATLEPIIRGLHSTMRPEIFSEAGWHIVDTEVLTIDQTLTRISALTTPRVGEISD